VDGFQDQLRVNPMSLMLSTLMMEEEIVSKTFEGNSILMWLIAQEDFIVSLL
jgi:hypothetical protein